MSHTGLYTPLHPLRVRAEDMTWTDGAVVPGVKITDPDGLDAHVPDWGAEMHTHETTEDDTYPGRTWQYLEGFKNWDFDHFNIERLAIPGDEAVSFWAGVSEHTEPFQMFATKNGWPTALDIVAGEGTKRKWADPVAYHVVCHAGDCCVSELYVEGIVRETVEVTVDAE